LIEHEELQTLIPHRGKMLLLSRVIEYDLKNSIRSEYDITEDCLFYDRLTGGVPAWVGFEFMAQAFSVLSGLRCREKGEKPKNGFILSVPFLRMEIPLFKKGISAEIRVRETDCTDMIYSFEGEVFTEGVKAVEGKLMVAEAGDEKFNELVRGYK